MFKHWSKEELALLEKLVKVAEVTTKGRITSGDFRKIVEAFPDRSRGSIERQIHRLRYGGVIEQTRVYRPWTVEEEVKLRNLYSGNKWRLNLKENFPDRDRNAVFDKAKSMGLHRKGLRTEAKELTKEQAALMAGLLLGDGSLGHRLAGHGGRYHTNTIEFSNTELAQVELFASMASNCNVNSYEPSSPGFNGVRRKRHYACRIGSKEAVKYTLIQIMPYLVGKKLEVAREMLLCLQGGHEKENAA